MVWSNRQNSDIFWQSASLPKSTSDLLYGNQQSYPGKDQFLTKSTPAFHKMAPGTHFIKKTCRLGPSIKSRPSLFQVARPFGFYDQNLGVERKVLDTLQPWFPRDNWMWKRQRWLALLDALPVHLNDFCVSAPNIGESPQSVPWNSRELTLKAWGIAWCLPTEPGQRQAARTPARWQFWNLALKIGLTMVNLH